jgi:hypothetical protein
MKHKFFPSSNDCSTWAAKTFKGVDQGQLGSYTIRCANAKRFEKRFAAQGTPTQIKVSFDDKGGIDRFQIVEKSDGDAVLAEP